MRALLPSARQVAEGKTTVGFEAKKAEADGGCVLSSD